jgi:hypothetical protein
MASYSQRNLIPLAILRASTTEPWAVQFAPDSHMLAAASGDIYLWDTDPQHAIRRICENTGDRINNTEWTNNIPDAPYQQICPQRPAACRARPGVRGRSVLAIVARAVPPARISRRCHGRGRANTAE